MKRLACGAIVAAIIAGFLLGAGRSLSLPGLYHEESTEAVYGLEIALGLPRTPVPWTLRLGGTAWPLHVPHSYDFSAFGIYLCAFAFALGGVSVESLRWSALLVAAGLLGALYELGRRWFSPGVALAACALLASHPTFVIWARAGHYVHEIFSAAFALVAAALVARWHDSRSAAALYAGCFVLGASANVSTKSLAFILALPAAYLAWAPRASLPTRRQAATAAACAVLGALNPILYAASGSELLGTLLGALAEPTPAGVDNLDVLANLSLRLAQLPVVLDGYRAAQEPGSHAHVPGARTAYMAALAAVPALAAAAGPGPARRRLGLLATVAAALFVQVCFTPMGLSVQHLAVLLPFFALAVPAGLDALARSPRIPGQARTALRAVSAAAIAALLAGQLRADAAYLSGLERSGGRGHWSDAINAAARHLAETGAARAYCLEWALANNLRVAGGGRFDVVELYRFGHASDDKLRARFAAAIRESGARFVAFDESVPTRGPRSENWRAFQEAVSTADRELVVEREFRDRAGAPIVRVYRARPAEAARVRRRLASDLRAAPTSGP